MLRLRDYLAFAALAAFSGSGLRAEPWNSPYPSENATKNILYDSFEERPKHLDPARSYSENEAEFVAQIYEPPLQYHFLRRPYQLVPLTVDAVPEPRYLDDEGRDLPPSAPAAQVAYSVYRFRLRPGIRFQPHPAFAREPGGRYVYHTLIPAELAKVHTLADFAQTSSRELEAQDYVYQIKRLVRPGLESPIAGVMSDYIVGLRDYAERLQALYAAAARAGQSVFIDLREHDFEGARVIDRYTWEIKINGKYPQFLYWQAMPFFAPMPWEAEKFHAQPGMAERNLTLDWYPVGTGPFMLAENNPNRRMILVRNPNYHGERYPQDGEMQDGPAGLLKDAGKPMPFVDMAIYSLETESIPRWSKFLQGYYDASGIGNDNFDQAVSFTGGEMSLTAEMQQRGIRLLTSVSASSSYVGFNMLDPVVGGLSGERQNLRRAIAIAVDMEEYVSIFTNGRGIPAHGPLPPGLYGHREGEFGINAYVYDWVDGRPRRKSLQEARRLLAEAGYPDGRSAVTGEPLVLYFDTYATGPESKSVLDWWRKQFAKLNIQLVIRDSDYNRFQEKMRKGNAQIYQWGWNADYPDPENFMFLLAGANGKVEHQGENASNYSNPAFDRLFEKMKHMENTPERQRIIDAMTDIVRRDGPWLWGFHPTAFSLLHSWYTNAKPNLMARNTLKYKRIDPLLREARRNEWNPPVLWPVAALIVVFVLSLIPAATLYRRRRNASAF
jgi:ABC-type transport system substrate-binding protein